MGWHEWVGYAASVLVAGSLMMSNVKRLRWANLAGAVVFVAYGVLVRAWPVAAVNAFIVGVNLWHLAGMRLRRDFFTLLPVEGQAALVRKFLRFHERDVAKFFPGASPERLASARGYFVLRNVIPVGLFLYEGHGGCCVEVLLDYVVPEYRDRKNADYAFHILNDKLGAEGFRSFVCRTTVPAHVGYLLREGFERDPEKPDTYRRAII